VIPVAETAQTKVSLELLSDPCRAAGLRDRVREFLAQAGMADGTELERFVLAVHEAFANIVEHAYQGRHDGRILVVMEDLGDRVRVCLRDFGRQPREEDLCPRDLDELRPGGLGLHFIEAGADEYAYDTSFERGTQLHLVKRKRAEKS